MIFLLQNFQRYLRAKLSFFYNKNEHLNPKIENLINTVHKMSEEIFSSNKLNRKETHKIFSKKVYSLIRSKKFLNFIQNSFIQQMFFIHNRFYLFYYLREMQKSKKWKLWQKLIKETSVGNPIRYFLYPDSSGNKIFQIYHLKKYEEFSKINLKKFDEVIEFGGGYGNMAASFSKINSKVKFTIFDTYEVNLLQYYYLKRLNLKVNFNSFKSNSKNINLINSMTILKSKILKIKKNKKKLLIANWSLSETPLNFRKKMFYIFKEFDYQLISFQKDFEKINNKKYFNNIANYNLKKSREVKLIPIKKMQNHFYLFSKK